MMIRDKRGNAIKVGDTLVRGVEAGVIEFVEVIDISEVQVRCSDTNASVLLLEDMDGHQYNTFKGTDFVSICACYRDAT